MLVDSHCHLNFPDYQADLDEVIARAREAGVGAMQTICTEVAEFGEVLAIAERYEDVYCSVGVHPNDSGAQEIVSSEWLVSRTAHPKVIGIGETGLDYYYENSARDAQKQSFLAHIDCARRTGLPLIVHTRSADEDTVSILRREMQKGPFCGVIHCFSTSRFLAEQALEMGFYLSLAGIVTFKKAEELRAIIRDIPLERLLLETDSPYLAPVPFRGKRNEPAYVARVAHAVAQIKEIPDSACAEATTRNFFRLFHKAQRG